MPGRKYAAASKYRYGFNGKEKDPETYGDGNEYDYGERIYNPRIVAWLSVDPLQKKFPGISPYVAFGNNPIIMMDPDGRDIVYFNRQGQEVLRIHSNTKFETFVEVKKKHNVVHNVSVFNFSTPASKTTYSQPIPFANEFQKVPMPDIITEKLTTNKDKDGNWIIEKGLSAKKYQQYDYQIAASTFLFNESKNDGAQFVTDGGMKIPTSITSKVTDVSPTDVKELMMQETHCGTDGSMNGKDDIMQVNNGMDNFADYQKYKANYGLSKGTVPGPLLSLTAGLKDLLTKGFHGSKVGTDKSGNITSITFQGWLQAGYNYNGNGVPNYLESLQHMESTKRAPTADDY